MKKSNAVRKKVSETSLQTPAFLRGYEKKAAAGPTPVDFEVVPGPAYDQTESFREKRSAMSAVSSAETTADEAAVTSTTQAAEVTSDAALAVAGASDGPGALVEGDGSSRQISSERDSRGGWGSDDSTARAAETDLPAEHRSAAVTEPPVATTNEQRAPSAGVDGRGPRHVDGVAPGEAPTVPAVPVPSVPPPADVTGLATAIELLRRTGESLAEQARSDALEIGFAVARHLFQEEVTHRVEPLLVFIKQAIQQSRDSRSVRICVSPHDYQRLESGPAMGEITSLSTARIEVVSDAELDVGDVKVETDFGEIDGRLSRRLQQLQRAVTAELGLNDSALGRGERRWA